MKMVMPLLAPAPGAITWCVPEGAVVAAGDLLARLALDDGAAVARIEPYPGAFPELGPPQVGGWVGGRLCVWRVGGGGCGGREAGGVVRA